MTVTLFNCYTLWTRFYGHPGTNRLCGQYNKRPLPLPKRGCNIVTVEHIARFLLAHPLKQLEFCATATFEVREIYWWKLAKLSCGSSVCFDGF